MVLNEIENPFVNSRLAKISPTSPLSTATLTACPSPIGKRPLYNATPGNNKINRGLSPVDSDELDREARQHEQDPNNQMLSYESKSPSQRRARDSMGRDRGHSPLAVKVTSK